MKKILWICIILLWWAIGLILSADYNLRVADFFCTTVHYCNNIQESDMINQNKENEETMWTENVIYTTGTQLYEVSFDLSNPVQQKLFEDYSTINSTCEVDGPFGIGGGPWCSNITWFTHTYTYQKLWISIVAYGGIMWNQDLVDNPWLLSPSISNPFVLSGSIINYSWQQWNHIEEEKILYKEFQNWETIEWLIAYAIKQKLDGIPYYNHREFKLWELQNFYDDYILYSINYLDSKNNRNRNNLYIFKPWKSYYYILDRESEATCIPVGCWYDKHEITYFTK